MDLDNISVRYTYVHTQPLYDDIHVTRVPKTYAVSLTYTETPQFEREREREREIYLALRISWESLNS